MGGGGGWNPTNVYGPPTPKLSRVGISLLMVGLDWITHHAGVEGGIAQVDPPASNSDYRG